MTLIYYLEGKWIGVRSVFNRLKRASSCASVKVEDDGEMTVACLFVPLHILPSCIMLKRFRLKKAFMCGHYAWMLLPVWASLKESCSPSLIYTRVRETFSRVCIYLVLCVLSVLRRCRKWSDRQFKMDNMRHVQFSSKCPAEDFVKETNSTNTRAHRREKKED